MSFLCPTPHTLFYIQAECLLVSGAHHNTFCIWVVRNGISILKNLSYPHVTLNFSVAPLHHGPSYNAGRYSSKYTDSTLYLFISLYTWLFPHCQITLSSKRRQRHNKERKLQANTPHEDSCSISNKLLAMTRCSNSTIIHQDQGGFFPRDARKSHYLQINECDASH